MRRPSTHDAIVIGAGPAGTSIALALARRGNMFFSTIATPHPRRAS
ncbi:monooxygenase, partial [Mesorhizobium sp. M4A.F.Ca.ET.020.02.1.1]